MHATDWLQRMIDSVGHEVKVQNLKLPDIRQRILDAKTKLDGFNAGVNSWQFPVVFTVQQRPYLELYDSFLAALTEVGRHKVAVQRTHDKVAKAAAAAKSAWRGERTKLKVHFVSKGVAEAIAKLCADGIWCSVFPPADLKITLPINSPKCEVTTDSTLEAFRSPFVVRYDASREDKACSPYELAFSKCFLENKGTAVGVMRECVAVMRAPPGLSSAMGVFDLSAAVALGVKGEGGKELLSVTPVPAACWTTKTEIMNLSYQSHPFKELPCFMQCMVGRCAMIVLSAVTVEKMGDVPTSIASAEASEISKEAFWLLNEGDCVWVPPASVAVCIGLPQALKIDKATGVDTKSLKQNQWHTSCMAVLPAFSPALTKALCSDRERASIAASWTRSSQWLPEPWKNNAEVKAWRDSLVEPVSADAPAAA